MDVPRLGVELEPQVPAYTTAEATRDPGYICNLHHSSRQCRILNPLSEARGWTHVLMDPSWVHYHWATMGTPGIFLTQNLKFLSRSLFTESYQTFSTKVSEKTKKEEEIAGVPILQRSKGNSQGKGSTRSWKQSAHIEATVLWGGGAVEMGRWWPVQNVSLYVKLCLEATEKYGKKQIGTKQQQQPSKLKNKHWSSRCGAVVNESD